jgi:hypothetical protein
MQLAQLTHRFTPKLADGFAVASVLIPALLHIATRIVISLSSCPLPGWSLFVLLPLVPLLFAGLGLASTFVGVLAHRKRAIACGAFAAVICSTGSAILGVGMNSFGPCSDFLQNFLPYA